MALHGAAMLLNQGGYSGYEIGNSVLFPYDHTQYLSWTPGSAGNRKTWTLSLWMKRSNSSTQHTFFGNTNSGGASGLYGYFNGDHLQFGDYATSSWIWRLQTTRDFRDVASWYHVVIAFDSTEATSTDRVKIWVNGIQETDFQITSYPSLNYDSYVNNTQSHSIGRLGDFTVDHEFDGYIAETHFVDGTAYSATDFGEFYQGGNKWRPIRTSGLTYGTNGFYLDFADSGALGDDESGNTNDWTVNGSPSQSVDSPTINMPTWNPIHYNTRSLTYSDGNTEHFTSSVWSSSTWSKSTIAAPGGLPGKYYFEINNSTNGGSGAMGVATANAVMDDTTGGQESVVIYSTELIEDSTTTNASFLTSLTANEVLGIALDAETGKVWFRDASGWLGSGNPSAGTNEAGTLTNYDGNGIVLVSNSSNSASVRCNFGQNGTLGGSVTAGGNTDSNGFGDFYYSVPTDFVALTAANLPAGTIENPEEYFSVVGYTGTGASNAITGAGFQSDFTWIKNRSSTDSHMLFDVLRGATEVLHSNESAAEVTEAQTLTSFDSDGFTVGTDVQVNTSAENYISWNWKANGAGVANTDGSVSSTVSVDDAAGFSIVTWDLVSGAHTVGHGQSDTVELIIQKNRDRAVSWNVYHKDVGETKRLLLNDTIGEQTATWPWNDTAPTTSVFSIGNRPPATGAVVGDKMLAYCFRSIPGYSKVFSYTGNGSADGTFVYLGFKPRWVLMKRSSSTSNWYLFDTQRSTFNVVDDYLNPNLSAAETTGGTVDVDLVSNGIKWRSSTAGNMNNSGSLYIGIAFAEYPFGGSNIPLGLAQ